MKVSVRDLKANLSRYLRDARAGREVTVTARGRTVARLIGIAEEAGKEPGEAELLRRLKLIPGIRLGVGGRPVGARKPMRIRAGQRSLSEIVLGDRR